MNDFWRYMRFEFRRWNQCNIAETKKIVIIMKLSELNEQQKHQLKETILCERIKDVSYGELCAADDLVSDGELKNKFGATEFVEEDFF